MQRARLIQDDEEYRRNQHSGRSAGGISGILVARGAERGQPQEAQHSGPKGEPGPTAPFVALRLADLLACGVKVIRKRR